MTWRQPWSFFAQPEGSKSTDDTGIGPFISTRKGESNGQEMENEIETGVMKGL